MSLGCVLYALSADDAALLASGDAELDPALDDSFDLDTAWGGIHYLLTGSSDVSEDAPRPEDFLLSGARLDASEHVAVHTAEEVAQFAAFLKDTSAEQLAERFDAEQMNSLNVYGGSWDSSCKADLTELLTGLLEFVDAAAEENQGMMVMIY
ncbi:DUF1877 family protein [Planctomycetota bacterium]